MSNAYQFTRGCESFQVTTCCKYKYSKVIFAVVLGQGLVDRSNGCLRVGDLSNDFRYISI